MDRLLYVMFSGRTERFVICFEENPVEGYETAVDGYNVTNTHEPGIPVAPTLSLETILSENTQSSIT